MISRAQFIRITERALRQREGHTPAVQAAYIADAIEDALQIERELRSDAVEPASPPPPAAPPAPAWPTPNPEAVQEPMVRLATSIPDKVDRVAEEDRPTPVLRKIDKPKLTVEDLNLLIQERTPLEITVDVPNLDGQTTFPATLRRNVLSAHAEECVKLVYFDPRQQGVQNDLAVEYVLHISEVPFDLPAIMGKLKQDAATLLRPREGPVPSRTPPVGQGPVVMNRQYPEGGGTTLPESGQTAALASVWSKP